MVQTGCLSSSPDVAVVLLRKRKKNHSEHEQREERFGVYMKEKLTSEENDKFWVFVEQTSQEVETNWPNWKKEGWDVLDRREFANANEKKNLAVGGNEEIEFI